MPKVRTIRLPLEPTRPAVPLDPDQTTIAELDRGEYVVAAAAGSGKTHTLCEWVAGRLGAGTAPGSLLVAAYNASAGAELRKRIDDRCGPRAKGIWAGTLHGLSWRLWREAHDGDPRGGTDHVIGTDQCRVKPWQVLGPALREAGLWDVNVRTLLAASERVREVGVEIPRSGRPTPELEEAFRAVGSGTQSRDFAQAAIRWEMEKARRSLIDFTDMMGLVYWGARNREPWAMELQGRFQYLALDEAQDANPMQVSIIEHLAVGSRCLLWVGDFRQSIYAFRGARPDLLRGRLEHGAVLKSMRYNHRSGDAIVSVSNRFATGHDWHIGGDSLPDGERGDGSVTVSAAADAGTEIVAAVAGGEAPETFAYLARTNAELASVESTLALAKVPFYSTAGGGGVWKTRDGAALLAYLRAADGRASLDELVSVANRPLRKVSRKVLETKVGRFPNRALTILEGCGHYPCERFVDDLLELAGVDWEERCELAEGYLADDIRQRTEADLDPDSDRLGLLAALRSVAQRAGSAEALEKLVHDAEEAASRTAESATLLSTVHKMKGGQRRVVYVDAALMPHPKATDEGEEERIFYVAITRARERLVVLADPATHPFASALRAARSTPNDEELEAEERGAATAALPPDVATTETGCARSGDLPSAAPRPLSAPPLRFEIDSLLGSPTPDPTEHGPDSDEPAGPRAVVVRLAALRALLEPRGYRGSPDARSRQYIFDGPAEGRDDLTVRVYSSVAIGAAEARGVGEDSVRVVVLWKRSGRPAAGRGAYVARTKNWRTNLLTRIAGQVEKVT